VGKSTGEQKKSSGEAAELTRDVLSVLAHELGGIASALDLRAHVISSTIPTPDLTALRDLAEELRVATRAIRLVRGPDGIGSLNPSRRQSLAEWWKLARRFVSIVTPRGTTVETRFSEVQVTASQASALTWLLLAALKELAERGVSTPCTLSVSDGQSDDDGRTTLVAEIEKERVSSTSKGALRWTKYAARIAQENGVRAPVWADEGAMLRWRCDIPAEEERQRA
jgi:hypothetical protein